MNPFDHIVEYLSDTLSEQDRKDFELAMDHDGELKKQVVEQRRLSEKIEDHLAIHHTRRYLDSLDGHKKKRRISLRPLLAVAAAITGLLIVAAIVISGQYQPRKLAQQNYFDVTLNGVRGVQSDDEWTEAINHLWKEKQFDQVIKTIDAAPDSLSTRPYYQYLKAHATYQLDHYLEAETLFGQIIQQPNNRYHDNAEWQLVLIALNREDITTATGRIESIASDSDHIYYDKANELNDQMKSIWFRLVK